MILIIKCKVFTMLLRFATFLSLFVCLFAVQNTVHAQEAASDAVPESAASELAKQQAQALTDKVGSVAKSLSLEDANHFFVMYTNYNVYSMVKAVRDDVSDAVQACSENNKSMADDLKSKFDGWETEVGGALEASKASITNMTLAQSYLPENDVTLIFGLVDEVRAVDSSRFEKTPVTTPEACEFMMGKMDETKSTMSKMLKGTLITYPTLIQKNQK